MKKRILSLALVLCMVMTLLPMSAFAADIVDSGTCGANLTWTLDSDGILTIRGTGDMDNYGTCEAYPWYCINNMIRVIDIEEGVLSIGTNAFCGCFNLATVTIPDCVTWIGPCAFEYCISLASLEIPEGVNSINPLTFAGCSKLVSVTIPDSVTFIGECAFGYCSSLESVTIPDCVTSIGDEAFYDTALYNDSGNWTDGVLYIGKCLIDVNNEITSCIVKEGTVCIADSAFSGCRSLTSVIISESVESIGSSAFDGCRSLESIDIATGNSCYSSINGVLFDKDKTSVLRYPEGKTDTSYIIPDSVTSIGDEAFVNCTSLTSVTIPDSVTSIGDSAFYGTALYNNLANWTDGVLYIGKFLIKADTNITSYTVKEGTVCIADAAFVFCMNLVSITIPDSVESIGDRTFWDCSSLASVTIPNSATDIGYLTFYGCSNLKSVTIPDSVTSIEYGAFLECDNLKDVYYNGSQKQWESISIGDENECLTNATIHFKGEPVHTHSYTEAVTAPTCTDKGYTTHTCACGDSYVDSYVNALGHNYVDGICTHCKAKDPNYVISNPFTDVSESAAYYDAVMWGNSKGIVSGFTATEFRPNATCTRAQVVTFLWRAAGSPEPTSTNNPFKDVSAKQANGKDNPCIIE